MRGRKNTRNVKRVYITLRNISKIIPTRIERKRNLNEGGGKSQAMR